VLIEIESVAARDRYFPASAQPTAEYEQFLREHPEVTAGFGKLNTFITAQLGVNTPFTDYVKVGS